MEQNVLPRKVVWFAVDWVVRHLKMDCFVPFQEMTLVYLATTSVADVLRLEMAARTRWHELGALRLYFQWRLHCRSSYEVGSHDL